MQLNEMSIRQLGRAYRDGSASPVEAVRDCLDAVDRHAAANAYCKIDADRALAWAKEAEERFHAGTGRGPLDGIPVAVKDVLHVVGWPTRRGSHGSPYKAAEFSSPAVDRLLEGGAVLVGKTTTSELGWKATTDSPLTGVTPHPHIEGLTSGGSSGGSASAVALSTVPVALGTDAGGSIRIPAAFCGIVGAVATYGRVPLWPVPPLSTLVRVGPLCRSVDDAATVLACISRPDPRVPATGFGTIAGAADSSERRHIGVLRQIAGQDMTPGVAARFDGAVAAIEAAGHSVRELTLGTRSDLDTFETLWSSGHAYFVDALDDRARDALDPGLLALADRGRGVSAADYLKAEARKAALQHETSRLLESVDVLLSPTVGVEPFSTGSDVPPDWYSPHWWTWAGFTLAFNLTGHPAVSLPIPAAAGLLPTGVQLVGRYGADEELMRFARAVETILK
ncbi:amidase family protein [Streptomyces sp. cmx-4-7]|uniref:amidase family protein n=1 Tax=Streptomyces sp. cmx-4-7 TaxID=2790939 RepID=UPI00397F9219